LEVRQMGDGGFNFGDNVLVRDLECEDSIRTSTAAILHRARLPPHKDSTKDERKALMDLKKDDTRILMKADKGNCFVVLDSTDYNNKMNALLNDRNTYELVSKSPFRRI